MWGGVLHRHIKGVLLKGVGWNFSSSVCEAQPVAFFFRERKVGAVKNVYSPGVGGCLNPKRG